MHEPYTQMYLHIVWATWDRQPVITPRWKLVICACIHAECKALKADVIALEAMPDHIHLFVRLPTTVTVATLVNQVKGASSHLITHSVAPGEWFKWQGAYGAFTHAKDAVPRIRAYVQNQEQHHRDETLEPELEMTETAAGD